MGRNKKKERMSKTISIRFTEKEFETVKQGKKECGFRTHASFMHHCILTRSEHKGIKILRMDTDKIEKVLLEISYIGKNINQVTKRLNSLFATKENVIEIELKKIQEQMKNVNNNVGIIRNMLKKIQEQCFNGNAEEDVETEK